MEKICKNCGRSFDDAKGFRNECPKDYCSWFCCNESGNARTKVMISITRAIYGKKSTPKEDREYTVDGSGSSAVATIKELKSLMPSLKVIKIKDPFCGNSVERFK